MNNIIIFDTTLRDGAQSPGIKMDKRIKLKIAHKLEELGVDVIEAGFPISSNDNFDAVKNISKEIRESVVCALARANNKDIEAAAASIEQANKRRIHTFISTSDIHIEKKLRMTKDQVLEDAVNSVFLAKKYTNDIEFSAEDAFRSNREFLSKVIKEVIEAGATTINLPDTVGYATPIEYGEFFKEIMGNVGNHENVIFSCHCHDDLGMAVANSLSAVQYGVRQVESTINGVGERAGNASLEEIVMAIKTRFDIYNAYTNIRTNQLFETSKMVEKLTRFKVQRNKAIVGKNAFSHESGIHQDGVLKNKNTYEIMNPSDVGWVGENIVLGKNSGRAALKKFIKENYNLEIEVSSHLFNQFKEIADKKVNITKVDLDNILNNL